MAELTTGLKQRFTKDYKLPIKLYTEPYFTERIEALDFLYGSKKSYNTFVEELKDFTDEDSYFFYYKEIKETIMNHIKSKPEFEKFNTVDIKEWEVPKKFLELPSKDIYHQSNIGRTFISIDMKKANFSSMSCFDSKIFDNCETWEDFISTFTKSQHIINSKYIREVILGNCNPKRQVAYEKYLMSALFLELEELHLPVVFFSNDEIIYDVTDIENKEATYNMIVTLLESAKIPLRIEIFFLQGIMCEDKYIGYIKQIGIGSSMSRTMDIKKLNPMYIMPVIKTINGQPIEYSDLVFDYEGVLCKMVNAPTITIT